MDANYWTTGLTTPAATRATGVVDPSRLGFAMSGVVDLGQSVGIPYGTVDVNSAASLEFLLGQQRFATASGMYFNNLYGYMENGNGKCMCELQLSGKGRTLNAYFLMSFIVYGELKIVNF